MNRLLLQKGFTLMELIIIIGLTIILAALVTPLYNNIQSQAQLDDDLALLVQTLRQARTSSVSGEQGTSWGVYFTSSSFTFFQGTDYSSRNQSYDISYDLSTAVTLTEDFIGEELIFAKYSGTPGQTGVITLNHAVEGIRQISVNELGIVEEGQ